ncbi:MAG: hypothetical protein ACRDYU_13675, partial [Actinomycetes bacterium]
MTAAGPHDPTVEAALTRLVREGTLSSAQADAVRTAVAEAAGTGGTGKVARAAGPERTNGVAEIAGYVGGALVAAAAGLFMAELWDGLSEAVRAAWLGGTAAVLVLAALAVATRVGDGADVLRRTGDDTPTVRRRLVGTLMVLGAGCAAGAAAVAASGAQVAWAGVAGLV